MKILCFIIGSLTFVVGVQALEDPAGPNLASLRSSVHGGNESKGSDALVCRVTWLHANNKNCDRNNVCIGDSKYSPRNHSKREKAVN